MHELSRVDAMFFGMELGHSGLLCLFTPGDGGPLGAEQLREHVAPRLPSLPTLNWRVVADASSATGLRWAEAEPDLTHHVREHRLDADASLAGLGRFAARLNG